ncbi:tail fiber domain-containing protein [Jejudonia soesokkakensis]|uniref:Tail fiber domain-containing protein n=1 Tax=Jejudonia soesokkakensis TaxID=1323432 RepID=A0ABW2MXS6_9FLAO
MKVAIRYVIALFLTLGMLSCSSNDDDNNNSSEICNNGIDDDGDGQIDCQDGDCSEAQNCTQGGSDIRLKENITLLPYGLSEVLQLEGKMYSYKADVSSEKRLGFIAQDVQLIMPELVSTNVSNDRLQIHYMDMMAVLVNAIQEQQILLDDHELQIEILSCQIEKQEQLK